MNQKPSNSAASLPTSRWASISCSFNDGFALMAVKIVAPYPALRHQHTHTHTFSHVLRWWKSCVDLLMEVVGLSFLARLRCALVSVCKFISCDIYHVFSDFVKAKSIRIWLISIHMYGVTQRNMATLLRNDSLTNLTIRLLDFKLLSNSSNTYSCTKWRPTSRQYF